MMANRTTLKSKTAQIRDDAELEVVAGGRDYNLGFGMHLFNMGDYWLFYTDAKGPVIQV